MVVAPAGGPLTVKVVRDVQAVSGFQATMHFAPDLGDFRCLISESLRTKEDPFMPATVRNKQLEDEDVRWVRCRNTF